MSAGRVSWRENAESVISAIDSGGHVVTGALVSLAPTAGMTPSAYVTWRHMVDALGIDPWVAGALALGVDALGIGLAASRVSLPRLNLTQHAQKLTVALYSYFGIVAVANICVSIQFSHSISAGVFESALALLPLPVALLMAVNSEVEAVARDVDNSEAKAAALRAEQSAEAAQIRAEQREERAQIRKEKQQSAINVPANKKNKTKTARTFDPVLLESVRIYLQAHKGASVRDVCAACGIKSTSTASAYMKAV